MFLLSIHPYKYWVEDYLSLARMLNSLAEKERRGMIVYPSDKYPSLLVVMDDDGGCDRSGH